MAAIYLARFDKFLNYLILFVLCGGGMVIHTLTALAIRGYYGNPWGYVAFLLPGPAEAYLACIQLGDNRFTSTILFSGFCSVTLLSTFLWLIRKKIKARLKNIIEI